MSLFDFIKKLFKLNHSQTQTSGSNSIQVQIGKDAYQKQISNNDKVEVYVKDNKTYVIKNDKSKVLDFTGQVKIVNGAVFINDKEIDI